MTQPKLKMEIFTFIYACCMTIFFAGETIAGPPGATPSIQITQTTHKFAPVITGTAVEHRFTARNKGTARLDIINVYTG